MNHATDLNGWVLAVYMGYTSQNFRLFHVSNFLDLFVFGSCTRGLCSITETLRQSCHGTRQSRHHLDEFLQPPRPPLRRPGSPITATGAARGRPVSSTPTVRRKEHCDERLGVGRPERLSISRRPSLQSRSQCPTPPPPTHTHTHCPLSLTPPLGIGEVAPELKSPR